MNFLELCQKRYSCRKYQSQPVPREKIERCLEAARLAPSACNAQPWYYEVVDTPELKNQLAEAAFSGGIYSLFSFAKEAPVLVAVVRDRSTYAAMMAGILRGLQYSLIDIGISVEHFVLQATEEGLGTCWIGWFDERAVKKVLGIPWTKKVDILITVGFSAEENESEKDRKPLEQIREFRNGLKGLSMGSQRTQ